VRLVRAEAAGTLRVVRDEVWGPVLVFDRLWEELGLKEEMRRLAARKQFDFDFERMVFAQTLQRFLEPGSDLQGSSWVRTVRAPGFESLRLPHFYRALGWLWKRFRIRKVVLVCDRGMVSAANLKALDEARFQYIVGMKMRGLIEVRDEVLGRAGRYHEVSDNLRVKEVQVEGRRYVVCFNPDEADKDRRDREATLEKIRAKLGSGGVKALINNRGYRRYLKVEAGAAEIDPARVKEDARYDGKYVLRTTTDLPAAEVAEAYEELTRVERLWRELKDVVEMRPVCHWRKKENVKGHIFVCFLALYLAALLRKKLADAGLKLPWDEVIRDLSAVRAVTVELGGEQYVLRSPMTGHAGKVFAAVGVKPPPLAQPATPSETAATYW
jgi:hypothetical protein